MAALAVGLAVFLAPGCAHADADIALALHESAIVIDAHSDTTPWLQDPEWDFTARHDEGHEDLLPALTQGLLKRGHSPEVVRKILGENLLRAMRAVEEEAG